MKKIDFNALLKAIIFGFFAIAIFYMGYTGNLAFVLHPKMFKFTYFAGIIFLLISMYMMTKIQKASSKKADLRILVFILPILFMFTDIQPLKGDALKNMSYDVLNNSKRIAQANMQNSGEQKSQGQGSQGRDLQEQGLQGLSLQERGSQEQNLQTRDSSNDEERAKSQDSFEQSQHVGISEKNSTTKTQDIVKEGEPKEMSGLEVAQAKENKERSDEHELRTDEEKQYDNLESQSSKQSPKQSSKQSPKQSSPEQDGAGVQIAQDHNVVNNSSIVIDTNISSDDEPLYLPSVSETKGKNYDIAKFLDDMLEAYSFEGDGSNKFEHQEFEIVGFVYRDDYFEKNRFMVGRILLTCCISDAQQIGVLVEGQEDYTKKFSDDSWVKVRGKLFWQELHNPNTKEDIKVLTLKPTKIEQIEDIAYPYVYFE